MKGINFQWDKSHCQNSKRSHSQQNRNPPLIFSDQEENFLFITDSIIIRRIIKNAYIQLKREYLTELFYNILAYSLKWEKMTSFKCHCRKLFYYLNVL